MIKTKRKLVSQKVWGIFFSGLLFLFVMKFFIFAFDGQELHIEIESTTSGLTRVYYPIENNKYSETRTYSAEIKTGKNILNIPFLIDDSEIRWDPIDGAGKFDLDNLYIKILFFKIPLDFRKIEKNHEIELLDIHDERVSILSSSNAKDPSVIIKIPQLNIYMAKYGIALVVTFIIFIVLLYADLGIKRNGVCSRYAWLTEFLQLRLLFIKVLVILSLMVAGAWYLTASLYIDINSSVSGVTRFYYPSGNGEYSESRTYVSDIVRGKKRFIIPFANDEKLRWDPVDAAGRFEIEKLHARILSFDIPLFSESVQKNVQIGEIISNENGVNIVTVENASDPSVIIKLPWRKVKELKYGIVIVFTLILYLIFVRLDVMIKKTESLLRMGELVFRREKRLFNHLLLLILISLSFWLVSLVTFSISIDDEYAMFRKDHIAWVGQGRWAVYLLTEFILPQAVVPLLPNLILCISLAISYIVFIRMHRLVLNGKLIAVFPIFMAFPTWYFLSEFYANILAVAVGLIITTVAGYTFVQTIPKIVDGIKVKELGIRTFVQIVSLSISIGCYQSFIFLFLSMGLGGLILYASRSIENLFSRYNFFKLLAYLLFIAISSLILYYGIDFIFKLVNNIQSSYISGFYKIQLLLDEPLFVIKGVLKESLNVYSGSKGLYGVSLNAIGLLMLIGITSLLHSFSSWVARVWVLILIFIFLITPFILNFLSGGTEAAIPYRSMVSIPYVVWFFSALAISNKKLIIKYLSIFLVMISSFQMLNAHANYNASKQLTLERDKALAAEIYSRILDKLPIGYDLSAYKVDFYGAKSFNNVFPKIKSSTIGNSFFDWDGGNPYRITSFMSLIGYNLNPISIKKRKEIVELYNNMAVWPKRDSVKIIDNVIHVKLGELPGLMHRF